LNAPDLYIDLFTQRKKELTTKWVNKN
jgi:hypothetical protein